MTNKNDELQRLQRRLSMIRVVIVAAFVVLLVRIWYLQVIKGEEYALLSEQNRIRMVYLQPPRGMIYDRHHNVLANNVPSFNLYVLLDDVNDRKELEAHLTALIGLDEDALDGAMTRHRNPRLSLKLKEGLTLKQAALIEANLARLPGIVLQAEAQRVYPNGPIGAHVVGYIGEVSPEALKREVFQGVRPGSFVGKYGVELKYDHYVRGRIGQKVIEVDALGHEQRVLQIQESVPGNDLYLTLDLPLQRVAEEMLGDSAGAIVAIDPKTGDVLALASHPPFDPNLLSQGVTPAQWDRIRFDPRKPMTNRATQGHYPPGSVFKIVMATAAFEIDGPTTTVQCPGQFRLGGRVFKDWKREGHGPLDLHHALVKSCDVYFYTLGGQLGVDRIAEYASRYGLGKPTGIDLPSEGAGIVPSRQWKQRVLGEPWYNGETISVAIGQGYVTVTPMQMVSLIATVANNGVRVRPRLLKHIGMRQNGAVLDGEPVNAEPLNIRPETIVFLQKALHDVVESGTGKHARSDIASIAGKTGTAQVASLDRIEARMEADDDQVPHPLRDHAWFVAFAPVEDPAIAVAVIIEHQGQGGVVAAPIARAIIDGYLRPATIPSRLSES